MTEFELEAEIKFTAKIHGKTPEQLQQKLDAILQVLRANNVSYTLKAPFPESLK